MPLSERTRHAAGPPEQLRLMTYGTSGDDSTHPPPCYVTPALLLTHISVFEQNEPAHQQHTAAAAAVDIPPKQHSGWMPPDWQAPEITTPHIQTTRPCWLLHHIGFAAADTRWHGHAYVMLMSIYATRCSAAPQQLQGQDRTVVPDGTACATVVQDNCQQPASAVSTPCMHRLEQTYDD